MGLTAVSNPIPNPTPDSNPGPVNPDPPSTNAGVDSPLRHVHSCGSCLNQFLEVVLSSIIHPGCCVRPQLKSPATIAPITSYLVPGMYFMHSCCSRRRRRCRCCCYYWLPVLLASAATDWSSLSPCPPPKQCLPGW